MKTLGFFSLKSGNDILKMRNDLGLTQSELAKALGYKRYQTICEYENGKKDIPDRFKVSLRSYYIQRKRVSKQ